METIQPKLIYSLILFIIIVLIGTWFLIGKTNFDRCQNIGGRVDPSTHNSCSLLGLGFIQDTSKPVSPSNNGNCPSGYYNYGVPLGCVPNTYHCTKMCPICLSALTEIRTPKGNINAKDIKVGMLVYSLDKNGQVVVTKIIQTVKRPVAQGSSIAYIVLSNNNDIFISPLHPTADHRFVAQLKKGDRLDGVEISAIDYVPYSGYTYDLLPQSDTGFYWANNILLASTLKVD